MRHVWQNPELMVGEGEGKESSQEKKLGAGDKYFKYFSSLADRFSPFRVSSTCSTQTRKSCSPYPWKSCQERWPMKMLRLWWCSSWCWCSSCWSCWCCWCSCSRMPWRTPWRRRSLAMPSWTLLASPTFSLSSPSLASRSQISAMLWENKKLRLHWGRKKDAKAISWFAQPRDCLKSSSSVLILKPKDWHKFFRIIS